MPQTIPTMIATQAPLSLTEILSEIRRNSNEPLWLDAEGIQTWRDLGAAFDQARRECVSHGMFPGAVVVVPGEMNLESMAWLLAVAVGGGVAAPLRAERRAEIAQWGKFCRIDWQVSDGRFERVGAGTFSTAAAQLFCELRARGNPGLILATGGTSGAPKIVLHDLRALLAAVPMRPGQGWRMLPLMRFDHIGGLDMAWRALAGGQVLVTPPAELSPETVAEAIARHRVEVMPATPSFLNLLLLSGAAERHDLGSLRIVPYGAEPMPPGLLRRLREKFPGVQFVQRFGTSETGVLPVVAAGDGLLIRPEEKEYSWKVVGDELWIRSPTRALGYLSGEADCFDGEGWFRTGDLVEELPEGGLRVLGRRKELINVGGEKVLPAGVESALLSHPEVSDCRVFAVPNALLGQVVAAEIVWRGAARDALAVKTELHRTLSGALPKTHLPAVVRLVETVDTTGNLKKSRHQVA